MEKTYWKKNKLVCGIDEAGRGPLFGPMYVAGVILPVNFSSDLITDSKKMTRNQREEAYKIIKENALSIEVISIDNSQIKKGNLNDLTKDAIRKIADNLKADLYIIDWIKVPDIINSYSPAKADLNYLNVAAASIVAKQERDIYIESLGEKYDIYDIKSNKGYGTKKHREAIVKYGYSDLHRKSFKLKK